MHVPELHQTDPAMAQVKAAMLATWTAGDFGAIARLNTTPAERFIEGLALPPGLRVLDVATGTGNLAIPLARAGGIVTGVDIVPSLLDQGRARATAAGLTITFDEGDAEALPYPDASFDAVVTMFGAMFAPRPELVAAELARVLKPGGRVAMGNWTPAGFSGAMFRLGSQFLPPPPRVPPPVLWGDDATVRARLQPFFDAIETERVPMDFDMPMSAPAAVAFFRRYFGPTQMTFKRLDEAGQRRFAEAFEALWHEHNTSPTPETHMLVPNEYLKVTAVRQRA